MLVSVKGAICKMWSEFYFKNTQKVNLHYEREREECEETTVLMLCQI